MRLQRLAKNRRASARGGRRRARGSLRGAGHPPQRGLAFSARAASVLLLGTVSWTACASPGADVEADALLCFSGGLPQGAEEAGTVEIGEAGEAFEPLEPDQELALIEGPTAQAYFELQVRFEGLDPGELGTYDAPSNPLTRFSLWSQEGERIGGGACGSRKAYVKDGRESYRSDSGRDVLVISADNAREIDGEPVRIEVEILDEQGRYAQAEVGVHARFEEF